MRDSDRIIGLLDSKTEKAERGERVDKHLLITRYHPWRAARGEMLSIDDVLDILSIPLLGIIPESEEVLRASNLGSPVTLNNAAQRPGQRLFRRRPPPQGRTNCHARSQRKAAASSTSCSDGKRHELVQPVSPRGSAPVARERLQILLAHERDDARPARSARRAARRNPRGDRPPCRASIPTRCRSRWTAATPCRRSPSTSRFRIAAAPAARLPNN